MASAPDRAATPPLETAAWALLFACTFCPPALVLALFSQASPASPVVLQLLAHCPAWLPATLALVFACCASWFFARRLGFIGSEEEKPTGITWVAWWALFALGLLAAALAMPRRPCFAAAALVLAVPALQYAARAIAFEGAHPAAWLRASFVTVASASACCFAVFLFWLIATSQERERWTDWPEPIRQLVRAHVVTWKMAFVSWILPIAVSCELGLLALLCWMRARDMELSLERHGVDGESPAPQGIFIMSSFKNLIQWLVAAVLVIWVGASTSATGEMQLNQHQEDMRDEVMGIAFCIFFAVGVWALDFCGREMVALAVQDSKLLQESKSMLENDWARGCLLLVIAIPIGLVFGCEKVGAQVYRKEKLDGNPVQRVTANWDWTSVIVKALWLGFGYVCLSVGVVKAFTVILAIVNEQLRSWPLFAVSALMFAIGFGLFMLPPAPAPPIYVVMGIVITSSALERGLSWHAALAWSTFVAYAMKLSFTVAAQKWIGEQLADNDQIRCFVGFHTPYTRALEEILTVPKATVAKVMILIGGPDWVVAVLCGMVRLPVAHVLLCISPVLLQGVLPCTASGALLLGDDKRSKGLAETFLALGAMLQLGAGVLAFFHVQEVLENDFDRLSAERPEDAKLRELDAAAAKRSLCFWREVRFESLSPMVRCVLVAGLAFMEASLAILLGPWRLLLDSVCFQPFGLTSSVIRDLGGDVLNIVEPLGWLALAFHAVAILCLAFFYAWSCWAVRIAPESEGLPLVNKNA